jgi:hypothetical protein
MDRRAELLRFIDRDQVGVEIGPWHTPLAPKRDGYRSISTDVFDTDTLRRRAVEDPNIDEAGVARIEDVDLIGPAQEIAELAAARFGPGFTCDHVLASHNLEHIPDPIRFLQGPSGSSAGTASFRLPSRIIAAASTISGRPRQRPIGYPPISRSGRVLRWHSGFIRTPPIVG